MSDGRKVNLVHRANQSLLIDGGESLDKWILGLWDHKPCANSLQNTKIKIEISN